MSPVIAGAEVIGASLGHSRAPHGPVAPGSCQHLRIATENGPLYLWAAPGGDLQTSSAAPFRRDQPLVLSPEDTQPLQFQIRSPGIKAPDDFIEHISRAIDYLVTSVQTAVGPERVRATEIELVLLADRIDFELMKERIAPELPPVSGFYSIRTNQAVVRYDARELEQTRRSAVHEISHLVITNQLGPIPVWLAEGLAEYIETIEFHPGGASIPVNQRHRHHLSGQPLPGLEAFFDLPVAAWVGAEGPRNYAVAWSLIYFLNQGEAGRSVLDSLLKSASANYCMPFNAAEFLASRYPGGVAALESDWRSWLLEDMALAWSASH